MRTAPMPLDKYLDDKVTAFGDEMYKRLQANKGKGGWESTEIEYLILKLTEEFAEFIMAIRDKDQKEVAREGADLANISMMLVDRIYGLNLPSE